MILHMTVYFPNGTTVEMDADSFMVDHMNHVLAVVCGDTNYAFPLGSPKFWKMTQRGSLQ